MPGALPDGEPVPDDGTLPESARAGLGRRPFGIYVHVPFCATRCGYCDFNTYTAAELGGGPSASLATYPALAIAEIGFARKVLGDVDVPVSTVFFGGGTPSNPSAGCGIGSHQNADTSSARDPPTAGKANHRPERPYEASKSQRTSRLALVLWTLAPMRYIVAT